MEHAIKHCKCVIVSGIPQLQFRKPGMVETYRPTHKEIAKLTFLAKFIVMEFDWWDDRNDNGTRLIISIHF